MSSPRKVENSDVFKFNLFKTILVGVTWMSEGMVVETIGPTLPDIRERYGASYEHMARVLSCQNLGGLIGCFVWAMNIQMRPHLAQPLLITSFVSVGCLALRVPAASSMEELGLIFGLMGFFLAGFGIVGPTLMTKMWKDKVTVPIHAVHIGFGLGGMTTPIIAYPYISHNGSPSHYGGPWRISGCFSIISGFLWAAVYFFGKKSGLEGPDSLAVSGKPTSSTKSAVSSNYIPTVIVLTLALVDIVGGEKIWSKFFTSYATKGPPQISVETSSAMLSTFWLTFVLGRIISLVLSYYVPIGRLIFVELSVNICTVVSMLSLGQSNEPLMHMCNAVFGLLIAPMYPSYYGWVSKYIEITPINIMFVNMGSNLGSLVCIWLTGYLIDTYSVSVVPQVVLFTLLSLAAKSLVLRRVMSSNNGGTEKKAVH